MYMRTPKEYNENIKKNVITKDMLLDCLWSVNKRAKNYRDKEREYREYCKNARYYNRYFHDKYHNEEKSRYKKEEYYEKKGIILSVIEPICIHKERYGYKRERIYDYSEKYDLYERRNAFVWENCYYDEDYERTVWFGDIEKKDEPLYHYYLFYDIGGGHTFHTPIQENDLVNYNLPIIDIQKLETEGHDISDLLSCQFVDKVIKLIQSGEYQLCM